MSVGTSKIIFSVFPSWSISTPNFKARCRPAGRLIEGIMPAQVSGLVIPDAGETQHPDRLEEVGWACGRTGRKIDPQSKE
jgi:hypothetical protein